MSAVVAKSSERRSLVAKFADKYSIEPNKLLATLKATAFRQKNDVEITDEQMAALLIVADQYGLNPFTKEIYAYPDKNNGIVPVVGVDGWSRIINEHPQFDGEEFAYSDVMAQHKGKAAFEWIECRIFRKDRSKPTTVREYFDEVVRNLNFATPWDTHPKRMHRHKALIQCARLAFGFAGIYDEDEAERIVERNMGTADVVQSKTPIQLPQPKSRQITQQSTDTLEAPALKAAEPVNQQDEVKAQATIASNLATEGERKFITAKLEGLGIDLQTALDECSITNFDKLTADGFIAMKEYIAEKSK